MDKKKRMQELVELLNRAGKAYYQESREIMSNFEYDALYDELKGLEEELGIVLASSPTIHVGYEVLSEPERTPRVTDAFTGQDKRGLQTEGICGKPESGDLLEDGRVDDCSDPSRRNTL